MFTSFYILFSRLIPEKLFRLFYHIQPEKEICAEIKNAPAILEGADLRGKKNKGTSESLSLCVVFGNRKPEF